MNEIMFFFLFLFKSAGNVILSSSLSGEIVKWGHSCCTTNHTLITTPQKLDLNFFQVL